MAPSRTKAQRAKRSFYTRREGLMRKLHEINTRTEASVALIGIYKGRTFCYTEDSRGVLHHFGIPDQFSDHFGPDDIELVRQRNHRSSSNQSSASSSPRLTPASTSTTTDTSSFSDFISPLTNFTAPLADSMSPALQRPSSKSDPLTSQLPVGAAIAGSPNNANLEAPSTSCRPPGLLAQLQQGSIDFSDIDFFN